MRNKEWRVGKKGEELGQSFLKELGRGAGGIEPVENEGSAGKTTLVLRWLYLTNLGNALLYPIQTFWE